MSCVIISPALSIHTHDCWRDSGVTFCWPLLEDKCAVYRLCLIMLNQKLSHKFKQWCKFSSCIKVKLRKKNLCKMRPACNMFY
jgi:hypothetical protein